MINDLVIEGSKLDILANPGELQVAFAKGEGYKTRFKGRGNCLEISAGKALSVLGLSKADKDRLKGLKIPLKTNDDGILYVDLSNYIRGGF
jgi:hypothetical protein